jgi:hypothetical protein
MKFKEPLMRILVTGSLKFFAISFWHVKAQKNLSLSCKKVWETVQDFCGAVKKFFEQHEFGAKPCLAHT